MDIKREIFMYLTSSNNFNMWELQENSSRSIQIFSLSCIKKKIMKLELFIRSNTEHMRVFAIPLLHN